MACASSSYHTITISDGTAHSFGRNREGALGLGHNQHVSLPIPIPNLPKINMISCGGDFAVCVDCEGFIWSFGKNNCGQLGTGNKLNCNNKEKFKTFLLLFLFLVDMNTHCSSQMIQIYGHVGGVISDNYVLNFPKTVSQSLKKHHFRTS